MHTKECTEKSTKRNRGENRIHQQEGSDARHLRKVDGNVSCTTDWKTTKTGGGSGNISNSCPRYNLKNTMSSLC